MLPVNGAKGSKAPRQNNKKSRPAQNLGVIPGGGGPRRRCRSVAECARLRAQPGPDAGGAKSSVGRCADRRGLQRKARRDRGRCQDRFNPSNSYFGGARWWRRPAAVRGHKNPPGFVRAGGGWSRRPRRAPGHNELVQSGLRRGRAARQLRWRGQPSGMVRALVAKPLS